MRPLVSDRRGHYRFRWRSVATERFALVQSLAIGALLSLVPVAITNGLETGLGWLNVTSERCLLLLTGQT